MTLLAQQAVQIDRIVEILRRCKPGRRNETGGVEVGAEKVGIDDRDRDELSASESSTPQRYARQIGIFERCKLEVGARQIGLLQVCSAEIGRSQYGTHEAH